MGAMALPPHWIPEDDVLLRNAVEAGASLESLAKGAVQFSRRFTVQELQDRWFSLLYDPVVSVEASEHMTEVERLGVTTQLRPNNLGVKDLASSSGKRKRESVRKYYYAMRKKICSQPFNMMGTSLISGSGYPNFSDNNEFLSADRGIVNPASNNLGAQGSNFDIRPHSFPEFVPHDAESTGNGVAPTFSGAQNIPENIAYQFDEKISLTGDCSEIPGFVQSKDLPPCNLFEDEDLVNQGSLCSEFGDQPFHSFDCSLPQMPIWCSSQEISDGGLPIQTGDGNLQVRDEFMIPPTANESDVGFGSVHLNPKLETPLPSDSMMDMIPGSQEYLELLFDLSNDEGLLHLDSDGNKAMENSYLEGLSSLLLESPKQCESSSSGLGEVAVAVDELLIDRTGTKNNKDIGDQEEVADARATASESTMKVGPEYRFGIICCTLNTEDPEIPSNDDVFLPYRFPSLTKSLGPQWGLHDTSYLGSSSVNNFSSTCNANEGSLVAKNNQTRSSAPKMEAFHPPNAGLRNQRDHGLNFELPESSVQHAAVRDARSSECPNHVSLANVKANPMEMDQGTLSIHQNFQMKSICCQNGVDDIAEPPNADFGFQQTDVPLAIDQSLLSDQEELWSENEFDVPYFSDVEAMVLDMDLSPGRFDFHTNPEVQRYQHEETKRTLIRLEQGADAFTQRALAGHGAFAHLYGRCSKYFIKKPEVLLGRTTDDTEVDIDLGREKNGGKISRRQATIKLDEHGVFQLKNLGRGSIYINGEEIVSGQSSGLNSGCLVEVKGLAFMFETNRKMIKQFVDCRGYQCRKME